MTTKNEMSHRLILLSNYFTSHNNQPISFDDILDFCYKNMSNKSNNLSPRTIQRYLKKIGVVKIKTNDNKNSYYAFHDKL